jgi:hypothetical protein
VGTFVLDVLKPAKVPAPDVAFVGGHATDIIGVLNCDVVVQIIERCTASRWRCSWSTQKTMVFGVANPIS